MARIWIDGIVEKYPKEILDGRLSAEASVIGLIWKDPLILDESHLTVYDFLSFDGRLFYSIARQLRDRKVNEFNEVAVISNVSPDVLERLRERGGYKAITKIANIVSEKNKDSILDSLAKYNIYIRLYNDGFNLITPILIKDVHVRPLDFFKKLTATEILEWYTVRITKMFDGSYDTKLLEDADVIIDDNFIEALNEQEEYGTPYAKGGIDVNGEEVNVFPYMSSLTLGFKRKATHFLAGFSSSGKTCLWCSIIMSMALQEKILIICNEQSSKVWKINILSFIIYKYLREYNLTKTDLMRGNFTQEQKDIIDRARAVYDKYYANKLHFIQLAENNMDIVKAKIRYYSLQEGYTMVIYDTLKIADLNFRENGTAAWEELVQYSRDLDILAKKYNLIMCASVQLAQNQKGALFLDSNMLSGAKGMVEQLDTLICIRDVYKEELDMTSKYFMSPFQLKKDPITGKYNEEPYECDPTSSWKAIFLAKARNAENSTSSGKCLLFNFYGNHSIFKEQCWGRPKHGFIGN